MAVMLFRLIIKGVGGLMMVLHNLIDFLQTMSEFTGIPF
jgi:hypothetical protein